jgi:ankyrin repeat protein
MFNSIGGNKPPPEPPKVAPPPALPGAQSNNSGAAPATKAPTDMEPNDALFDAINRGDLAAARDAISRGADLSAQNVLGMTPLELSVDLGRNDISFVLLSMRGGDGSVAPPSPATKAAAGKSGQVKQAKETPARSAKVTKVAQPAQTQTPRLFAGDGGTPNPNAGFLGFDSGHR